MTTKTTVSINFELDKKVNKGLTKDSKKHGRSKRSEARFALNAWYLLPEVEREKLMQQVDLTTNS
ncbi:TraY domain-containing protein [Vibrio sinaloensis]|uniref:TraY domain-containing protein n=1 Tax=Photobacterium sp. (strain ATCC 43367) TaxID=379097 RepID=UPI0035EE1816